MILIIGILLAGLVGSTILVKNSRIATSQALTESSPVNGISQNALWLETSLEKSFVAAETEDGASVNLWNDIKNSATTKNNVVAVNVNGDLPKYSNTINYIHAIKFTGNDDVSNPANGGYFTIDGSFLNNTNYTIFVVEKRQSSNSNNYFIASDDQASAFQSLLLGYKTEGTVIHSKSGTTFNDPNATDRTSTAKIQSYGEHSNKPRILTFNFDTNSGGKIYINGMISAKNAYDTIPLSGVSSLNIGKGYSGEIGEIIVFTRTLKTEERKSVEDYLSKKWSIKLITDSSADCTGSQSTVTENGCEAICSIPTITGVSSPTSIQDKASSKLTCGLVGYAGGDSIENYTCLNGVLQPIPNPNLCVTSSKITGGKNGSYVCDVAYSVVNNTCQKNCTLNTPGITNRSVLSGSTSSICDSPYSGSVSYTCEDGSLSITTLCGKPQCTGGTESTTTISGVNYKVRTFEASGTLNCDVGGIAQILVVGGGGSGGSSTGNGAGGGGGGVVYAESYPIAATSYSVTVGAGGAFVSTAGNAGNNGYDSVFGTITAFGGGGGGAFGGSINGKDGGSGGGGAGGTAASNGGTKTQVTTQTNATSFYGNNGGSTQAGSSPKYYAGGGGGAGEAGTTTTTSSGISGKGGDGISNSITGTPIIYGAGGGGSGGYLLTGSNGAVGGSSVGGTGSGGSNSPLATNGSSVANGTAGNGGGGGKGKSGSGSRGVVIVRYAN